MKSSFCAIQAVWIYRSTLFYMIRFKRSSTYEAFHLIVVLFWIITFLNAAIWAWPQLFYCSTWKFLFSRHHSFVSKAPVNSSFLTCPFQVMFHGFYIWLFGPAFRIPQSLLVQNVQCFPAASLWLQIELNIYSDNWALSKVKVLYSLILYRFIV